MFTNIQKITLASLFSISLTIALMTSTISSIEKLSAHTDEAHSEDEEGNEAIESSVPSQVKLYMKLNFSLSDILGPDVNISARHGIEPNQFTKLSSFEGATRTSSTNACGVRSGTLHTLQNRASTSTGNEHGGQSSGRDNGNGRSQKITHKVEGHVGQASTMQRPMWAVHSYGASSGGLLNPEEEVQKFFGKPTVFEESEDMEVKDALEVEKKSHRGDGAAS